MAPVARLMTPELRNVTTSAMARAAYTPPLPRPRSRKATCSLIGHQVPVLPGPSSSAGVERCDVDHLEVGNFRAVHRADHRLTAAEGVERAQPAGRAAE